MHAHFINGWEHDHQFLGEGHARNERRARLAIIVSLVMVAEIAAGLLFGSMALLADGLHMATHVGALGIAAYIYARRYQHDPRFAFGTGKLGDLAGFTSAVMLGFMAAFIGWESLGPDRGSADDRLRSHRGRCARLGRQPGRGRLSPRRSQLMAAAQELASCRG